MAISRIVPGPEVELRQRFLKLRTISDVAKLLGVTEQHLNYLAFYRRKPKYKEFFVRKRRGGARLIAEPIAPLKLLQERLLSVLKAIYVPRHSVHGFVDGRSIATNAQTHMGRQLVLNLDLQDFFPTINFGRVRGMLLKPPYNLGRPAATVLAQLCCHNNALPQGAPTSPILANMVSRTLDRSLELLARKSRCRYTRYADDLTFSTDRTAFPPELVKNPLASPIVLGEVLLSTIEASGFRVNDQKVRMRSRSQRQEVTGLTVNVFPNVRRTYVRKVRAMLHAWRVHGHDAAEVLFLRSDTKDRGPHHKRPRFRQVVKGKLDFFAMVRGNDDGRYLSFLAQYSELEPGYHLPVGVRRSRHLKGYKDAVWVIEGDHGQGTAFELDGYGFVTCDHVLHGQMQLYRPSAPDLRVRAEIVAQDAERDIAVLRADTRSGYVLKRLRSPAKHGDSIRLVGFPQHSHGSSIYEEVGHITGFRAHMGQPLILVSVSIVAGASGAPVLDSSYRVIGVAVRGRDSFDKPKDEAQYGVIPISALDHLSLVG